MQLKLDQGFLYDVANFFGSAVAHVSKVSRVSFEEEQNIPLY
ncbi:unnamed protein product [Trichobilharzia regenti]|nr:unnamed protein product [Trichobilharzia regenti]